MKERVTPEALGFCEGTVIHAVMSVALEHGVVRRGDCPDIPRGSFSGAVSRLMGKGLLVQKGKSARGRQAVYALGDIAPVEGALPAPEPQAPPTVSARPDMLPSSKAEPQTDFLPSSVAEDRAAVDIPDPAGRWLVLSDLHVPYHDTAAIRVALDFADGQDISGVILLGDMLDFYQLSRWDKNPEKRPVADELFAGRQLLHALRTRFPDARIYYKEGNHEERLWKYIWSNAGKLQGIEDIRIERLLDLANFGVTYVGDRRLVTLGKLALLHGHEFFQSAYSPVNPARGLYLRGHESLMAGHFHQTSQHTTKSLRDRVTTTWSVGALCNLRPLYAPFNNWNHGFAVVEIDSAGAYSPSNYKILDGKVWR